MIKLDELTFKYGKKELFSGLDLKLEAGNIYGLLGKNGAGKTTLLKIMGGLLFPMEGKATFDGIDITKREPSFLEEVFFLPEEFYLPPVKGEVFAKLRGPLYPNFNYELFMEFINDFDVDITKNLNSLSFGQKKKFLLSFGLATGTKIIIMDEPTNGLDIPSKTILRRNISKAMSEERTILISTHQVKDVENLIDPIIVLEAGKIVFNQSIESISSRLSMKKVQKLTGKEIYSQEIIGGYEVVLRNEDEFGAIDMELLFNSIILDPRPINQVFLQEEVNG